MYIFIKCIVNSLPKNITMKGVDFKSIYAFTEK